MRRAEQARDDLRVANVHRQAALAVQGGEGRGDVARDPQGQLWQARRLLADRDRAAQPSAGTMELSRSEPADSASSRAELESTMECGICAAASPAPDPPGNPSAE